MQFKVKNSILGYDLNTTTIVYCEDVSYVVNFSPDYSKFGGVWCFAADTFKVEPFAPEGAMHVPENQYLNQVYYKLDDKWYRWSRSFQKWDFCGGSDDGKILL